MSTSTSASISVGDNPGRASGTRSSQDGLPDAYELVVTTTSNVLVWTNNKVTSLFTSGTGGIVAAKRISSNMLAVADSSVVVLHNIKKGKRKSYHLKDSQGNVRLLKYTGNDSQDLYFTTSLHNSVQAFSIKDLRLLDTRDAHPSPPTIFALSLDSRFLLSSSQGPQTLHLRELSVDTPATHFRPTCSSSAVVAAGFHPETAGIFVLAFGDGAIAIFDAEIILRRYSTPRNRSSGATVSVKELASVKRLHTPTSNYISNAISALRPDDKEGKVAVTHKYVAGVSSVALLPGHRAVAVTVGSDGKCCVVDFSQPNKQKAVLLRSWHLRKPATSLSILLTKPVKGLEQYDGPSDTTPPSNKDYCIAVGRQDGKVLLFDLEGTMLGAKVLDSQRGRIVDLDWAKKEIDATIEERKARENGTIDHRNDQSRRQRKMNQRKETLRSDRAMSGNPDSSLPPPRNQTYQETPLVTALRNSEGAQLLETKNKGELMPLFFTPQPKRTVKRSDKTVPAGTSSGLDTSTKSGDQNVASSSGKDDSKPALPELASATTSPAEQISGSATPPLPPRPVGKPGGRLHTRRALKALEAAGHDVGPLATTRRISRGSLPSSRSSSRRASTTSKSKREVVLPLRIPSQKTTAPTKPAPAPPPLHSRQHAPVGRYKTPLSSGSLSVLESESEAGSSDTIIEWSTARKDQHAPATMLRRPTYKVSPEPKKKAEQAKKGHISLNVSSSETRGERIPSPESSSPTPAHGAGSRPSAMHPPGRPDALAKQEQPSTVEDLAEPPKKDREQTMPSSHSLSSPSKSSSTNSDANSAQGQPIQNINRDSAILSTPVDIAHRTHSHRADVLEDQKSEYHDPSDSTGRTSPVKQELGFAKLLHPASWMAGGAANSYHKEKQKGSGSPKRKPVPMRATGADMKVEQRSDAAQGIMTGEESPVIATENEKEDKGAGAHFPTDPSPATEPKHPRGDVAPALPAPDTLIAYLDRKFAELKMEIVRGFEEQKAEMLERERRRGGERELGAGVLVRTGTGFNNAWSSGESNGRRVGSVFGRVREERMRGVEGG